MRGSATAPAATASRSDHAPAQKIAFVASVWPWRVGQAQRSRANVDSRHLAAAAPPLHRLRRDRRSTRARRRGSRRCRCPANAVRRTPRACGSTCSISAPSSRRRPATPLASPRRCSSPSGASCERVGREDQLAAALVRDRALVAVRVQLARSLHAQPRLQRAGPVVDARVDHARAVAGLVRGQLAARARARTPTRADDVCQLARDGQPDDAAADDRQSHSSPAPGSRHASPSA